MCDICAYADLHGVWPMRGTHCGFADGCHRSWAGFREAHCAVCHAHFSADSVAEKHRVNGKCLDPHNAVSKTGKPLFRSVDTPNGVLWRNAETLTLKPAFVAGKGPRVG